MTTNGKPELRLNITTENDKVGGYFHIRGRLVTVEPGNGCGPVVRNVGSGESFALAHLVVTSQGSNDDKVPSLYAWETRIQDVYAMELSEAENVVKVLKSIDTKMEKQKEKLGPPTVFADYLIRVGLALGVNGYITEVITPGCKGSSYDDAQWRLMDTKDAHYHVRCQEHTWKQSILDKAETKAFHAA